MSNVVVIDKNDLDEAAAHYVITALWSSIEADPNSENPEDPEMVPMDKLFSPLDFDSDTLAAMRKEIVEFVEANHDDVVKYIRSFGWDWEQLGHDLWLTRNHHGTGFWDRGLGAVGDRLAKAAHALGSVDLYSGDDGLIYSM